jgi:hypothetical protein
VGSNLDRGHLYLQQNLDCGDPLLDRRRGKLDQVDGRQGGADKKPNEGNEAD